VIVRVCKSIPPDSVLDMPEGEPILFGKKYKPSKHPMRNSRLLLIPTLFACHYLVSCKEKIEIRHRAPANLEDQIAQDVDTTNSIKPEDFAKEFEMLKKEHKGDSQN